MNHQKNSQLIHRIPFDPIDQLMGFLNIRVVWHFRMNGCHTLIRSVIMYDQIMSSLNSLITLYKMLDFIIFFRIDCFSDQRLQRVFCNSDTGPHNYQSDSDPHNPINIKPGQPEDHQRQNRCTGRDHISHRICKDCHHHLGINLLSQLFIKYTEP